MVVLKIRSKCAFVADKLRFALIFVFCWRLAAGLSMTSRGLAASC